MAFSQKPRAHQPTARNELQGRSRNCTVVAYGVLSTISELIDRTRSANENLWAEKQLRLLFKATTMRLSLLILAMLIPILCFPYVGFAKDTVPASLLALKERCLLVRGLQDKLNKFQTTMQEPRACYALCRNAKHCFSIRQAKARKCKPATVSGSRS